MSGGKRETRAEKHVARCLTRFVLTAEVSVRRRHVVRDSAERERAGGKVYERKMRFNVIYAKASHNCAG